MKRKQDVFLKTGKEAVMYDSVTFQIEEFSPEEFNHLTEYCIQETPKPLGDRLQIDWGNLRINYFPKTSIIKVSNSLHKFYNGQILGLGAINSNDYTMSNLTETVEYLELAFQRDCNEMKILGRFEYGFNIVTGDYKPYADIIERFQSVVTTATNPFNVFYNKSGKPYSKFCSFTHYTIKCYDKGKQSGLYGTNILRYEIVHKSSVKTKNVFGWKDISLADLLKKEIWDKCYTVIMKSFDSIRVLAFPSDGIEAYTKTLCYSYSMLNKDFKKNLKPMMAEFKLVHDNLKESSSSPHSLIRKKMKEKFEKLITT
ncbi:hypothetical protein [Flavobacterium sp. MK4S-17]|uniref:hypothetical protein n=1 Tax=Flavobacterium sp. MK4S-17 TaxID=2543737 RepID=UPI0013577BCA|nr:hypothetical protein [Flavobacterium sp. MK4S-17]